MRRAIKDMKEHYIVCGAGATGYAVLTELIVRGDPSGVRRLCAACGATMARGPAPVRGIATVA